MVGPSFEQYITVVDNAGRQRHQRVEYTVHDVRHELVYVTAEGLRYIKDSLWAKSRQRFLLDELGRIPDVLANPDIVIWDSMSPKDTLIYYKQLYIRTERCHRLVAVIVKVRSGVKFLYNFHVQESDKVKGYRLDVPPEVWYLNSQRRKREFGL